MPMWVLVTTVLILQEFASSAIVFIDALQSNFPIWTITLIWICCTLLDMYVGYMLGRFTRARLQDTRFGRWVEGAVTKLRASLGTHGARFFLALLGTFDFPYMNTFIGAWIGMPMKTAILLTLAGNFIWYLFLWATVLGLSSFFSSPDIILLILIGVGVLSHFSLKLFHPKEG